MPRSVGPAAVGKEQDYHLINSLLIIFQIPSKKLILKHKNEQFESKYKSLNIQYSLIWKTTINLLKLKEFCCPIKKSDGLLALSDIDKANLFGEHLSDIFTPHPNSFPDATHSNKINNSPHPTTNAFSH